jgi:hypothetical protein
LQKRQVCPPAFALPLHAARPVFQPSLNCLFLIVALTVAAPCSIHAQQRPAPLLAGAAPVPSLFTSTPVAAPDTPPPSLADLNLADLNLASPALANTATDDSSSPDSAGAFASSSPIAIDEPPANPKPHKHTPEGEIAVEGMVSYGNWQIFAAGTDESLYTAGLEYDRHSWGYFAGAQMDYVAEVLPLVLLKEPTVLNEYGVVRSRTRFILPGFAFSPIGLRMQWRHNKAFKPYFNVKGGAIGFTQKALSPDATYYDFSLQESIGFYLKMSQRLDLRFGLFGDFHFSNAYITAFNPGLDVMNSNLAVSYHFGG